MSFFTYVGMYTCAAFVLLALIIVGLSLIDRPARKREAARLREMEVKPTAETWPAKFTFPPSAAPMWQSTATTYQVPKHRLRMELNDADSN